MKVCTQCQEPKGLEMFSKDRTKKDGLRPICKSCTKAQKRDYYRRNSDRVKANARKYEERNREASLERKRKYYSENRDRLLAAAKDRYDAPAKREYDRQRLANDPEARAKHRESGRRWAAENPEKINARTNARRRRVRRQQPPWANTSEIRKIYQDAQAAGLTVDHIIPLKGEAVSGLHVAENLQLLSMSANAAKGNSFEHKGVR